ncbi:MAG TPA: choice-of-anchor D domain-containing protein, partial [Pirellulales bacterium]|nr:choice-of-anchor D domain-containing protein [Pirellulales bacterium]
MRQLRAFAIQGLETRRLLTASLQAFNGSTQLMNGSSDSFGSVMVGSTDSQSWTLKNVGDATLTVSSDWLPSGFMSPTALPLSINPGQSTTFVVSLNTSSMGSYGGQLEVFTNAPNSNPFTVMVNGMVQQSGGAGGSMQLLDGAAYVSNGGSDSLGTWSVGDTAAKT